MEPSATTQREILPVKLTDATIVPVSFFQEITPPPDVPVPRWRFPPVESHLAAVLPWTRIVGASATGRIALEAVRCWPKGLSLDLAFFAAPTSTLDVPPDRFRVGVTFADGRRAADSAPQPISPEATGEDVLLLRQGGIGNQLRFRQSFYLSPLPPEGPFSLVVEWPDMGIGETWTEFNGTEVRDAATRAIPVW